jgi:hypothetical protein
MQETRRECDPDRRILLRIIVKKADREVKPDFMDAGACVQPVAAIVAGCASTRNCAVFETAGGGVVYVESPVPPESEDEKTRDGDGQTA